MGEPTSTAQTTTLAVPVHYDFASSLCYVAHRAVERIDPDLDRLGIELVWTPLDLTRISGWRRGDAMDGLRRENVLRAASELGVELRLPPVWPDSRRAMAVSVALGSGPRESAWRERVWTAVFEEGRALDGPGELERLGADLDLDVQSLASPRAQDELETRTLLALESNITGVPAFVLDDWPLSGMQDAQTMRAILERFAQRHRTA